MDIEKIKEEMTNIRAKADRGENAEASVISGRLIRSIKKEIRDAKNSDNEESIKKIEDLKKLLDVQLEWHGKHLKKRYSEEFIHEKADFKSLVTVLPKAVGIAVKRVTNSINKLKEAKSNKEKAFGLLDTVKETGLLVATPVIYAAKFIVSHWYLIFLFLSLFKNFRFGKGKDRDRNDKDKGQPELEPQTVLATDSEMGKVRIKVPEAKPAGLGDPNTEPNLGRVPKAEPVVTADPNTVIIPAPKDVVPKEMPQTVDPVTVDTVVEKVPQVTADPNTVIVPTPKDVVPKEMPKTVDPITVDTVVEKVPQVTADPNTVIVPAPKDVVPKAVPKTVDPVTVNEPIEPIETLPALTDAETAEVQQISEDFFDSLESNYGFFIGERHPEVEVVHSADEFREVTGVNSNDAEWLYERHAAQYGNKFEGEVMWPEVYERNFEGAHRYFSTREELAEYILSGQDPNLQMYLKNYKPPEAFSLTNLYNNSGFAKTMENLGIPAAAGVGLFALYELVQYGLAVPTQGATLALPF